MNYLFKNHTGGCNNSRLMQRQPLGDPLLLVEPRPSGACPHREAWPIEAAAQRFLSTAVKSGGSGGSGTIGYRLSTELRPFSATSTFPQAWTCTCCGAQRPPPASSAPVRSSRAPPPLSAKETRVLSSLFRVPGETDRKEPAVVTAEAVSG